MFSIGEFSKATGLTVKTLRFYHEQGLLVPSCVDEATGYRYYDASKIEQARGITFLRGLELPLEEIGAILRSAGEDADVVDALERHREIVREKKQRLRQVEVALDQWLSIEKEARRMMKDLTFAVVETTLTPVLVAGIRMRGRYAECTKGYTQILKHFGSQIAGKPMLLHYDREYKAEDADFEPCFPIRKGTDVDGISVRELPGGTCLSVMHKGPWEQLGRSYATIVTYMHSLGRKPILPTREIYHKGPGMIFRGNPKNYLTEIQFLLQEEAAPHLVSAPVLQ